MYKVKIVSTARTPIGIIDGNFKDINEQKLGAIAMQGAIKNAGIDPSIIDEIIVGVSKQTSMPSNCARYAMLEAKLPVEIPAYTVQRQSASGLQAIANGYWQIKSGNAQVVLTGGTENMSLIPSEIHDARYSFNKNTKIIFDTITSQMTCAQPDNKYGKITLEFLAQNISKVYNINENDTQEYTRNSINKVRKANYEGLIVPVEIKKKKVVENVRNDEFYCNGGVIAGPADSAAMCILAAEEKAKEMSLNILGEIISIGFSADNPSTIGILGIEAIKSALNKAKLRLEDIDIIEINELLAAQCIAICSELKKIGLTDNDVEMKVNPNGGSLATGNPWGASGAILLTNALYELNKLNKSIALIVTPAEGGQAMAMLIRKEGNE